MKKLCLIILAMSITAIASNTTYYIDGKWYSCDKIDYDEKGNEIRVRYNGFEIKYKNFYRNNSYYHCIID